LPNKTRFSAINRNNIKAEARNFVIPIFLTTFIFTHYFLEPTTFQYFWKGRAPYLLFLWLLLLELTIAWKKLPKKTFNTSNYKKILAVAITTTLPMVYIVCTYVFGLNRQIMEIGKILGVPSRLGLEWFLQYSWPLSLEYSILTIFIMASIWLIYGIGALRRFSVSLFFLGATAFFYMIDTFHPYGTLKALQNLVPCTASSTAYLLNQMGYETRLFQMADGIQLWANGGNFWLGFAIFWPSSGLHSLFIYTFMILLFVKSIPSLLLEQKTVSAAIPKRLRIMAKTDRIPFPIERKKICIAIKAADTFIVNITRMMPIYVIVAVGAVGTFFVNVLRILTIYVVGLNTKSEAVSRMFHDYFGELYFVAWILTYLIAIGYGHRIWTKLSTIRVKPTETRQKQKNGCEPYFK